MSKHSETANNYDMTKKPKIKNHFNYNSYNRKEFQKALVLLSEKREPTTTIGDYLANLAKSSEADLNSLREFFEGHPTNYPTSFTAEKIAVALGFKSFKDIQELAKEEKTIKPVTKTTGPIVSDGPMNTKKRLSRRFGF